MAEGMIADEGESEEDEIDEQPGVPRAEQSANGERRPRRRGRRGGRRRRGGPEDGLAGSIVDELGPASPPEAADAVADFDGGYAPESQTPAIQYEPPAPSPEPQHAGHAQPEPVRAAASHDESVQEAERAAARRRSTVREKVSFGGNSQADTSPIIQPLREPAAAPQAPAPTATGESQPRKAGWWSRRFGGGE